MANKTKRTNSSRRARVEVPNPASVRDRFTHTTPTGKTVEVLRTDQRDEYEQTRGISPRRRGARR